MTADIHKHHLPVCGGLHATCNIISLKLLCLKTGQQQAVMNGCRPSQTSFTCNIEGLLLAVPPSEFLTRCKPRCLIGAKAFFDCRGDYSGTFETTPRHSLCQGVPTQTSLREEPHWMTPPSCMYAPPVERIKTLITKKRRRKKDSCHSQAVGVSTAPATTTTTTTTNMHTPDLDEAMHRTEIQTPSTCVCGLELLGPSSVCSLQLLRLQPRGRCGFDLLLCWRSNFLCRHRRYAILRCWGNGGGGFLCRLGGQLFFPDGVFHSLPAGATHGFEFTHHIVFGRREF